MKKLLCKENPVVNGYPEYGFIFSLIDDVTVPWVMNIFIEFEVIPEWELFISYVNHNSILQDCPYINNAMVKRNELLQEGVDIARYAAESIAADTCLFLYLDRFYISGTEEYRLKHYIHNSFVVGCDTDKEIIYLADNFNDGKYSIIKCSYDDFRNAFRRNSESIVYNSVLQNDYKGDVVKYLKDIIDKTGEAYIFAEKSDIKAFKTCFPMAHDLKIVGYDNARKRFRIESYFAKKPVVSCSFDEIGKAYRCYPKQDEIDEIVLLKKVLPERPERIDLKKIVPSLEEYISPSKGETKRDGYTVGHNMFVLDYIHDKIWIIEGTRYRFWQFLYERAMLMEFRVKKLEDMGVLPKDDTFSGQFVRIKKGYLLLRNLFIKADIDGDRLEPSFADIMAQLISGEKESIRRLTEILKAYIDATGNGELPPEGE